jgi:hypothetical protein
LLAINVNLASNTARIKYKPARTKLADVLQAINSLEYVPDWSHYPAPTRTPSSMLLDFLRANAVPTGWIEWRVTDVPNAGQLVAALLLGLPGRHHQ